MNLDLLTKAILKQSLSPSPEKLASLQGEILDMPEFFLVADVGQSQIDWESGNYFFYIEKHTLIAFLSQMEAAAFVSRQNCVLPSGDYPIVRKDNEAFSQLILHYEFKQLITSVKIYARTPIHIKFAASDFRRDAQALVPAPPIPQDAPTVIPTAARVFCGVEAVKKALDTFEPNARRKLDPGRRFENIHTLIQTLAQQNEIDPDKLDRSLKLSQGYSRNFFTDIKGVNPSIDVVRKYLTFFGLQGYLYLYKSDSRELIKYLGSHKVIDKFGLRTPPMATAERFRLNEIIRGTDGDAYVYKLVLTSDKNNTVEIVVSNPLKPPLVIGREYQLLNRGGKVRDVDEKPARITDVSTLPSNEEMSALVAGLENKSKKKTDTEKSPRSYEEQRKDEIIRYFRTRGMDTRSATAKFRDLESEDDILDEFYKYITKKQFGKFEQFGFSARKLIKEMHMDPYEAYLSLVQLRTNPQETKQRLIYRERDPQYQKKPKKKEAEES